MDFNFPATENGYFVIDEKKPGTITLRNFSSDEQLAFMNSLLGLHDGANIRDNILFVLKDHVIYQFGFTISENDILFDYNHKQELDIDECEILIQKDDVTVATISLDAELKGYYLKDEFAPGVYKVILHNLVSDELEELSVTGATQDCYKDNVSFDASTNELTVINSTQIDFRMDIDQTSQIELFDLGV